MEFIYFKGPKEDMDQYIEGTHSCSICSKESDLCFSLEYTLTDKFTEEEKENKIGCVDCLRKGHFEFWHDTEFGMLDKGGLKKVYNHNMENPPNIANEILRELRRTPQIATWQQELWLTHCNDFMVYKGTWQPEDFNQNSKSGDGKQLFMEMTDKDWSHLWDDSSEDGAEPNEWDASYYVFECRHCSKLRGNWDSH